MKPNERLVASYGLEKMESLRGSLAVCVTLGRYIGVFIDTIYGRNNPVQRRQMAADQ
jgi:hypothetical protein